MIIFRRFVLSIFSLSLFLLFCSQVGSASGLTIHRQCFEYLASYRSSRPTKATSSFSADYIANKPLRTFYVHTFTAANSIRCLCFGGFFFSLFSFTIYVRLVLQSQRLVYGLVGCVVKTKRPVVNYNLMMVRQFHAPAIWPRVWLFSNYLLPAYIFRSFRFRFPLLLLVGCRLYRGNFRYFRRCLWDLRKIYYHDERKLSAAIIFICCHNENESILDSIFIEASTNKKLQNRNKFSIWKRCYIFHRRNTTFSAARFPISTIMTITIVSPQQPHDLFDVATEHNSIVRNNEA